MAIAVAVDGSRTCAATPACGHQRLPAGREALTAQTIVQESASRHTKLECMELFDITARRIPGCKRQFQRRRAYGVKLLENVCRCCLRG